MAPLWGQDWWKSTTSLIYVFCCTFSLSCLVLYPFMHKGILPHPAVPKRTPITTPLWQAQGGLGHLGLMVRAKSGGLNLTSVAESRDGLPREATQWAHAALLAPPLDGIRLTQHFYRSWETNGEIVQRKLQEPGECGGRGWGRLQGNSRCLAGLCGVSSGQRWTADMELHAPAGVWRLFISVVLVSNSILLMSYKADRKSLFHR